MELASATSVPVREPVIVGDLAPLAQRALTPRMERIAAYLDSRELLQEVATRGALARPTRADNLSRQGNPYFNEGRLNTREPNARESSPVMRGRIPAHDRLFPQQNLYFTDRRSTNTMGLREVEVELRSLRAEIHQLSRVLGMPTRASLDYRGIMQQFDGRDSDVQLDRFRDLNPKRARRAELPAVRAKNEEIGTELREQLQSVAADIERHAANTQLRSRRAQLLRALDRAERNLRATEADLLPGVKDRMIGEIYRARYSIGMFGGVQGVNTAGLTLDASV